MQVNRKWAGEWGFGKMVIEPHSYTKSWDPDCQRLLLKKLYSSAREQEKKSDYPVGCLDIDLKHNGAKYVIPQGKEVYILLHFVRRQFEFRKFITAVQQLCGFIAGQHQLGRFVGLIDRCSLLVLQDTSTGNFGFRVTQLFKEETIVETRPDRLKNNIFVRDYSRKLKNQSVFRDSFASPKIAF